MKLKPINECKTVAELLADKSRWTRKACYRDSDGEEVCFKAEATCFCLYAAVEVIYGPEIKTPCETLRRVIGGSIICFNDAHTYEEVYAKVLEAGI
jgi:hypothetical protein